MSTAPTNAVGLTGAIIAKALIKTTTSHNTGRKRLNCCRLNGTLNYEGEIIYGRGDSIISNHWTR